MGVDQEDRGQRQTEDAGIDEEQRQRRSRRQPVDAEAEHHHQAERREDKDPHQRALEDCLAERRKLKARARLDYGLRECEPRDQPGQRQAGHHVVVDADHVGAQTRVDRYLGPVASPGGGDIPVEVGHERPLRCPGVCRVGVRNPDAG